MSLMNRATQVPDLEHGLQQTIFAELIDILFDTQVTTILIKCT